MVRFAMRGQNAGSTFSQAWNAPCWSNRRKILWSFTDRIRPIPHQWATNVHGDVLASFARQKQNQHLYPGDEEGFFPGCGGLYPEIKGASSADPIQANA